MKFRPTNTFATMKPIQTTAIVKVTTESGKNLLNEIPGLKGGMCVDGVFHPDTNAFDFKWNGLDAVLWVGQNAEITNKRILVQSMLDKVNEYDLRVNHWNHHFDNLTIYIEELDKVVPGANGIQCQLYFNRCRLHLISITKAEWNTCIPDEKRVAIFDKLPRDVQSKVANFIISLEAIGNARVFPESTYYSAMRPKVN